MSEDTQVDNQGASGPEAGSDWLGSVSDEIRNDPSMADIQNIEGLAKGYVHAQHMIGSDKVVLPGKDATDEQLSEFYNKLGRPETADGYETPTENMAMEIDAQLAGNFFEEAHRIGLSKTQAAALMRWQAEQGAEMQDEYAQRGERSQAEAVEVLQKEFGDAFDEKLNLARDAALQFGGEELMEVMDSTGLGNHPEVIKAFAKIGRAMASDEVVGGGGRQNFRMSPAEAKMAIESKKQDPNFMKAYTDKDTAGHAGAVKEMSDLFTLAYPESN